MVNEVENTRLAHEAASRSHSLRGWNPLKLVNPEFDDQIAEEMGSVAPEIEGPGDIVKEKYDQTLRGIGQRLWQGVLQVAQSSFGKGAIAMGLVLAIGTAASIVLAAPVPEAAIGAGLTEGFSLLTTNLGLGVMAIGGAIGAIIDTHSRSRISATEAQRLAKQYEQAREINLARRLEPVLEKAPAQDPFGEREVANDDMYRKQGSFCACELEKRAQAKTEGQDHHVR